jgi:hypothetical protein
MPRLDRGIQYAAASRFNEVQQHESQNDTASSMLRRGVLEQHPLKKWMTRRFAPLRIISQSEE